MCKVVISNVFSDRNRGGAAITAATIGAVRRALPNCEISLIPVERNEPIDRTHPFTISDFPDVRFLVPPLTAAGRFAGLRGLARSARYLLSREVRLPEALEAIKNADVVVSKGGHVFVNRRSWRDLLSLWSTAFPVVYASRCKVPVVLYSQSFGPFPGRLSRVLNRFLLKRADLILPRDRRSLAALVSLGINPHRVRLMPDSVLGLEPPPAVEEREISTRFELTHGAFAAVSVRRFPGATEAGHDHYIAQMSRVLHHLLDDRTIDQVALVVQSLEDTDVTIEFAAVLDDERVVVCGAHDNLGPRELLALYGAAKFTLATRLHSAIFSFVSGTPSIAIALVGEKAEGVFESVGCGSRLVPFAGLDSEAVCALVREALGVVAREELLRAVATARSAVVATDPELRRALDNR